MLCARTPRASFGTLAAVLVLIVAFCLFAAVPATALAQDTAAGAAPNAGGADPSQQVLVGHDSTGKAYEISAGDTAWMLTSSALVLMMTGPGLALFYGGLVRCKKRVFTSMPNFPLLAFIS